METIVNTASEALEVSKRFLLGPNNPEGEQFICWALEKAERAGLITSAAYVDARTEVVKAIYPYRTLANYLANTRQLREPLRSNIWKYRALDDPEYLKKRDEFLNTLIARLNWEGKE